MKYRQVGELRVATLKMYMQCIDCKQLEVRHALDLPIRPDAL